MLLIYYGLVNLTNKILLSKQYISCMEFVIKFNLSITKYMQMESGIACYSVPLKPA